MIKVVHALLLSGAIALTPPATLTAPLRPVTPDQLSAPLGHDTQLWTRSGKTGGDKAALLSAINHSLRYLRTPKATQAYQRYAVKGITRDRVIRSLERFRQLLQQAASPAALAAKVKQEFSFYEAVGKDGQGQVEFTGYFEPTYTASPMPTAEYRYPLYKAPADFQQWSSPHPTRADLEGVDGLQASKGPLRGLELVWFRDRLEAFLVQVQGSARLSLTTGGTMSVGYAGKTKHPYSSIGKELVKDGKFSLDELSLPLVIQHFQDHPQDLNRYLPRNKSFVFFRETNGAPATGSLGVPVTGDRSIATDKTLMPPGALALLQTQMPNFNGAKQLEIQQVSRYVLDQDTGSAITGPGRADIFMGTGPSAKERAGRMHAAGKLYYLLLK